MERIMKCPPQMTEISMNNKESEIFCEYSNFILTLNSKPKNISTKHLLAFSSQTELCNYYGIYVDKSDKLHSEDY